MLPRTLSVLFFFFGWQTETSWTCLTECCFSFISAGVWCYPACQVLLGLSPRHLDWPRQRWPVPVRGPVTAWQLHRCLHRAENPSSLQTAAGKLLLQSLVGGFLFVIFGSTQQAVSVRGQACSHCGCVPGHVRRRVRSDTFPSRWPSRCASPAASPLGAVVLPAWTGWALHGDSGCRCSAENTALIIFNEYYSHCTAKVTDGLLLHPLSVLWVLCLP